MSKARVLLVANNFPPVRGGSAVVYGNLARWAQDRMIVLAPRLLYAGGVPLIGWREHDRGKPYRIIRLSLLRTRIHPFAQRGFGKLLFMVSDALIRARLVGVIIWLIATQHIRTICVGELLASSWIIRLFRFVPGVRTIAYVHGEEITTEDRYDTVHRRGRRALLDSDGIIVVSRFTQQTVQTLLAGRAAPAVSLVENGVDGERFCPGPRPQDLVALYRLKDCFVFISVCRLLEKKGVDHAIRAFSWVVDQRPNCRFLVIGAGPYQARLKALAAEIGAGQHVVFAGQVVDDDLVEHYRLGDVFVMPNRELPNGDTEGFGLVFLEANSCGLPVIAGRDGGSTDAVSDGENGLVVDGNAIDAIANAMLRLHDDCDLRERLRANGLAMAAGAGWAEKTRAFLTICLPDGESAVA